MTERANLLDWYRQASSDHRTAGLDWYPEADALASRIEAATGGRVSVESPGWTILFPRRPVYNWPRPPTPSVAGLKPSTLTGMMKKRLSA